MKETTCCFSGHRILPPPTIERITKRLDEEIENLIRRGVRNFISGGAVGFDQIAAALVIAKKTQRPDIRLILALPCRDQDILWRQEQRFLYHRLLEQADEIIYVSRQYHKGCMKQRNYYLVDQSAYCICALLYDISGTGQTVRYATKNHLHIINVAAES